jgi:branched-chain amino acid aminotransferase
VTGTDGGFRIGGQSVGPDTQRIRESLVAIQRGTAPDPHDWIEEIA